ncbi:MAG TPA: outer membrane beta-barrel protein [Thermoanaerobaculia bacterium]|nr:outer membrane beta-barrel protein [Thermoanaerobaculia bacterium]
MRPPFPVLLLAALAAALPAAGQSYSDPGTGYGVDAGYARGREAESGGVTGGLHARLRLTGGIGLEVSAGYRRDSFAMDGARVLTVDEIPLDASLLLFFPNDVRVQPYLLAGIGYTWAKPRGTGSNAGTSYRAENLFALHGGLGVDVRTSFRSSVFVEGRWVFLDVDAVKALPGQPKSDYLRLGAGFNLYF